MRMATNLLSIFIWWPVLAASDPFQFKQMEATNKDFYISAAPDAAAFKKMAALGIGVAIDLREAQEKKGFEALSAKESSMEYLALPVSKVGPFIKKEINAVNGAIKNNYNKKIWIYCSSGNRASAWLVSYLVLNKKYGEQEAIKKVGELGFMNQATKDRIQAYLKEVVRD